MRLPVCIFAVLGMFLSGCADVQVETEEGGSNFNSEFKTRSSCGIVVNDELKNPPAAEEGLPVRITQVIDGEFVVVEGSGPVPLKLLVKTLGAERTGKAGVEAYLQRIGAVNRPATFFKAGASCDVVRQDGGYGSLFSFDLHIGAPAQEHSQHVRACKEETPGITLGQVMKILKERFGGQYDGKLASAVVKRVIES